MAKHLLKNKDIAKKMSEFINMLDNCHILRTPWFIVWIHFENPFKQGNN